jgi:hypothetical protein
MPFRESVSVKLVRLFKLHPLIRCNGSLPKGLAPE